MVLRKLMGIFACALILCSAALATAGVPDLAQSSAATAYTGAGSAVMFNIPNGGGSAFTGARNTGGVVDATVTLTLLDGLSAPIVNFPFEDMWLESDDGGMAFCTGGTTADANTDANGQTTWATPLQAGGSSMALTVVMISGGALTSGDLAIAHNSADISGDGVVNLTDVPLFVNDFYGAYAFRSDFAFDAVINLSDVVRMGTAIGASCP